VRGQRITVWSDDQMSVVVWELDADFAAELRAAPRLSDGERRRWLGG